MKIKKIIITWIILIPSIWISEITMANLNSSNFDKWINSLEKSWNFENIKNILEKKKSWETLTDDEEKIIDWFDKNKDKKSNSWSLNKENVKKNNSWSIFKEDNIKNNNLSSKYSDSIDKNIKNIESKINSLNELEKINYFNNLKIKLSNNLEKIQNSSYNQTKKNLYIDIINYTIQKIDNKISKINNNLDNNEEFKSEIN